MYPVSNPSNNRIYVTKKNLSEIASWDTRLERISFSYFRKIKIHKKYNTLYIEYTNNTYIRKLILYGMETQFGKDDLPPYKALVRNQDRFHTVKEQTGLIDNAK